MCLYCILYHSFINILIFLLVCVDALSLKNVEQYTSTQLSSFEEQTESEDLQDEEPPVQRLSVSPSRITIAYEKASLYDDASYSNWITLFPNMTIRAWMYWILCVLFLVRHFFLLFSRKQLESASLPIRCVIYFLNGGLNKSTSIFYEFFLLLAVAMLNHVFIEFLFDLELDYSSSGDGFDSFTVPGQTNKYETPRTSYH